MSLDHTASAPQPKSSLEIDKPAFAQRLQLTVEQVQDLIEAFELFDTNGDGGIGAKELHIVLNAIGRNISFPETEQLIAEIELEHMQIDEQSNSEGKAGELDIYEFLRLMAKEIKESEHPPEELEEAFLRFGAQDIDDDISPQQLREAMEARGFKLNEHELELLMHMMDAEGKECVSFKDFIAFFMA